MPLSDIVAASIRDLRAYHTQADPPRFKLDANEGPDVLTPEERARVAAAFADASLHRYPDLTSRAARAALAAHLGAAIDELVVGVGSDEVIGLMMRAFSRPRDGRPASTLFVEPSFVMYGVTAHAQGLLPHAIPLEDPGFAIDVAATVRAIETHRPNLVFVASPNNPTGNDFGDDALSRVIEAAKDSLVVLDEAYAPFMRKTRRDWVRRYENVAVLGTLSKVGFAGLRFGWVELRPELARELEKVRPPYNLNAPTQHAVRVVLEEMGDAIERAVALVENERDRVREGLSRIPEITVYPSDANFLLIGVEDAVRVHRGLLSYGVSVRRFDAPRLARHLRVTIGKPDENTALLEAIASVMRGPG